MHIFLRMTIHILMGFRHEHLFMNDNPYYYFMGFRHAHLCTNDYPYSYGFSSCTSLYEWLFISLCLVFCHAHFCTNHISVWMTSHILMSLQHAHLCTNDYSYIFCLCFYHAHFCTNDYPYSFGFFVMYIFVRMNICSQFLSNAFLLNDNSEFLGIFSSNVSVSPCAQCSPTLE